MKLDKLSPEEKETLIQYDMRSGVYLVTTVVPKHLRRFTKLFGPGKLVDGWGTRQWTIARMPSLPAGKGQKGGI